MQKTYDNNDVQILRKSSVMPVTNTAATHNGQEKKTHVRETREDTHRGTIFGVRVKTVGEKRDKSFACAFSVFTRLRCCILKIFSEYCGKMHEIKSSDIFFNELFYGNLSNTEKRSVNKGNYNREKTFLFYSYLAILIKLLFSFSEILCEEV